MAQHPTVVLPGGERIAQLGQGTWQMAVDDRRRDTEVAALRHGIDLGLTLIDTAEMYGEGRAEELVADAVAGRRNDVFIVSKVYPHNASRDGVVAACERSLKRLRTDRIDLYLLHWMGRHPLAETVAGFEALSRDGKIRHWGVSNLDADDMDSLSKVSGGERVATNQVLYNLTRRSAEWALLPWQRARGIPLMAYSPVEQARLIENRKLVDFARAHGATPAQVALAWLLAKPDVIVIPKAGRIDHVEENAAALGLKLDSAQLSELDRLFPAPSSATPIDML
jgi:diketogulonate reductase-like aldo/keto reductase